MNSSTIRSCFSPLNPSATTAAVPHRSHVITPRHQNLFFISFQPPPWRHWRRDSHRLHSAASDATACAEKNPNIFATWLHTNDDDGAFGGWAPHYNKPQVSGDSHDYVKLAVIGIGTSVVLLVAALVQRSFNRKGIRFQLNEPLHAFRDLLLSSEYTKFLVRGARPTAHEKDNAPKTNAEQESERIDDASNSNEKVGLAVQQRNPVICSVGADSTQQDALRILKKLTIIDIDIKADGLCTRREYARWLIKTNSILERSPRQRIVPSMSIARSMMAAFDDVNSDDPDYWCIQALGEAGIVPSILSTDFVGLFKSASSDNTENVNFHPESYISRFDLVKWRILWEYPFDSILEKKMLRTKEGFMDLSAVDLDAFPQLVIDLMAGDKSIIRRVFGNTRRLEPHKPATKAQAAVALTSGRMAEAIQTELSRIEAENQTRLAEMAVIRSDLVSKGEIRRYWEDKIKKEREHAFEVEKNLHAAFVDLESRKMARNECLDNYNKEKAALECQRQLISSLREEIDEMSGRLANEKTSLIAERESVQKLTAEVQKRHDAISETKAVLEAEKEALQILRSWVEEEAFRTQARIKILEGALQRWNWSDEYDDPPSSTLESNQISHEAGGEQQ